jgi:hypothetical protein
VDALEARVEEGYSEKELALLRDWLVAVAKRAVDVASTQRH